MEPVKKYDYIIAGAGAAGLSLVYHLLNHPIFSRNNILIIDKERKIANDRTWCFWEKGVSIFEPCVTQQWSKLKFASSEWNQVVSPLPYRYKMIEGHNFYDFCWRKIALFANVTVVRDEIESIVSKKVYCRNYTYEGQIIFNSALFAISKGAATHHLLQHFKGWYLKFENEALATDVATLMDFTVAQDGDCRFMYVLPTSTTEALIEYTAFSHHLLNQERYDQELLQYISNKFPHQKYQITHTEYGVIPMTNVDILSPEHKDVYSIGTAGYATKASSGYTFPFIQRQCRQIIAGLESGTLAQGDLKPSKKYQFYDAVLLNVLATHKYEGWKIFSGLFKKLPASLVLKFLNEESSFWDDLRIMNASDKVSFTKAGIEELLGKKYLIGLKRWMDNRLD